MMKSGKDPHGKDLIIWIIKALIIIIILTLEIISKMISSDVGKSFIADDVIIDLTAETVNEIDDYEIIG